MLEIVNISGSGSKRATRVPEALNTVTAFILSLPYQFTVIIIVKPGALK